MATKKMYPQLEPNIPDKPELETDPQIFRLTHIKEIQNKLEKELETYSRCKRRYSGVVKTLNNLNLTTGAIAGAEGVASVALLSTGVGAPIALALAGVSVGTAVVSSAIQMFNKRFGKKQQKHISLTALACSKLASLKILISKALEDSKISDSEFKQIQTDFEDYKIQKQAIQNKMKTQTTDIEKIKNDFLEEGKKLGMEEASKKLNSLLGK